MKETMRFHEITMQLANKTGNKVVFRACAAILFVDFEKGANINKAIKLKILIIFERKNRQIIVVSNSNILRCLGYHRFAICFGV
jgi:hypothetical protein